VITIALISSTSLASIAPIIGDISGNFVVFASVILLLILNWKWRPQLPNRNLIISFLSYSARMFFGSIGMIANLRIGTILIAFWVTKDEIGYFSLAMSILTQLGTLSDALNNILLPRIANSKDGRPELVARTTRWISTIFLGIGVVIILTAKWYFPVLFSSEFNPSIIILWILFPGMWFRAISKVLFAYFNGINLPQIVSLNIFFSIVLNAVFMIWLLPIWGLISAVWITTAVNILSGLLAIYSFRRMTQLGFLDVLFVNISDIFKTYQSAVCHKKQIN
jgi:O-antigen/teichoic acid export membrane protein